MSLATSLTTSEAALQFRAESAPDGLRFIVASGEFEASDDLSPFEALAATSQAQFVTFDSPGGNLAKAIELGRLIRRFGLSTIQLRNLRCTSACAVAFFGGVKRAAEPGSIGVHQSSFGSNLGLSTDEAVSEIQRGTAHLISYLVEMGVDPALLTLALTYDSTDMRYLSGSEMAQYRVTTPMTADVAPSSSVAPSQPEESNPAPARQARLFRPLDGHDVVGFDFATLPNVTREACQAACSSNAGCRASTYNKKARYCFLKSDAKLLVKNKDAFGSVADDLVSKLVVSSFVFHSNSDMPGGDYKQLQVDFTRCYLACEYDLRCQAFAFVRKQNSCWLKDQLGVPWANAGVDIGIR